MKTKTDVKEDTSMGDKTEIVTTIHRTEEHVDLNTVGSHNFNMKPTACRKNQISKHIMNAVLKESGGICQCTNPKHKKGSCNNILVEGNYYFYGSGDNPSSYRVICRRCRDSYYIKNQPNWEEFEEEFEKIFGLPLIAILLFWLNHKHM